jgi:hypothetical protein
MTKPGRNDPCHCGSGKKYKRCCLAAREAEEAAMRRTTQETAEAAEREERTRWKAFREQLPQLRAEYENDVALIDESNAIVDLIHEGRLDEAEARARALMAAEPHFPDGLERLGHVYEKRGDLKMAAKHYREAVAMLRGSGLPEDEHQRWLLDMADRLDPPSPT